MLEYLENVLTLGYVGIFLFSLLVNLIPFIGPSNLVIAGIIGSLFPSFNPFLIGSLIALGATISKTIHFGLAFFAGATVKRRQKNDDSDGKKRADDFQKLGMIALFIAAASPIPDGPIVIPLGLMRYSPIKFFIAFFTGKIIITILATIVLFKKETILKTLKQHHL